MGITTSIIQLILLCEIAIFSALLVPFPHKKTLLHKLSKNFVFRGFKHVLLAVYAMISLLFFDSILKIYKGTENIYFLYHAERNMYLTAFTLFLALVLNTFLKLLVKTKIDEENAAGLKKQAMNQKDFVAKMIEQGKAKEAQIKALEDKIKKNEMVIKQLKNNSDEYFRLLDKYNGVVEKLTGEKKKDR